jgi:alkylhydroperoxidase family enzyme
MDRNAMLEMLTLQESGQRIDETGVHERYRGTNLTRTVMHSKIAGAAFFSLCSALAFENKLDSRLRELMILRTAWRVNGQYVLAQHKGFARFLGMSDEEIFGVAGPDECRVYSELDRAIIRMADELLDDAKLSQQSTAFWEGRFPPDQILELILAGGYWRMVSTVTSSMGLALDEGVEPWPEGL